MMHKLLNISVKGKRKNVLALEMEGVTIIKIGRFLTTAEIFDEYWLEAAKLPDPDALVSRLRRIDRKPDLFTFTQRVPEERPQFDYYFERANFAVLPLSTYEVWRQSQISSATRRNIRASEKRGIVVKESSYDQAYVQGIMSIYNETPVRQGRKFWHHGKDFSTVDAENGTYADRSSFLAAYYQGEMIGYLKVVWDKSTAAIMQILSKIRIYDKRPNNALLAGAVNLACSRGISYLLYEQFVYGKKSENSLTEFKKNNGFVRMDVPRYYIPLTKKGLVALKLGLHRGFKERIPEAILAPLREWRSKWYEHQIAG